MGGDGGCAASPVSHRVTHVVGGQSARGTERHSDAFGFRSGSVWVELHVGGRRIAFPPETEGTARFY